VLGDVIAYEILLMLDPELPDDRQGEIVSRVREAVEKSGGSWDGDESWGRRKLAYEIDHKPDGTYHLLNFTTDAATLDEISRVLKITEGVMRHLPTRRIATRPGGPVAARPEPVEDQEEPASPVA
jgi:small subunit ribosomal protein S6